MVPRALLLAAILGLVASNPVAGQVLGPPLWPPGPVFLPPWTGPASSSPHAAGPKTIVFVQGVATTLTTGTFDTLQRRLAESPWNYRPDSDFLTFSYTGGTFDGGRWQPNPYPCEATFQDLDTSAERLYDLLATYNGANPSTRLVVVAHSLGGIVSMRLTDRLAENPTLAAAIDGIVTNDSPVNGFSRENIELVFGKMREARPTTPPELREAWCNLDLDPFSHTIVNQVAGLAADPATPGRNQARVARMRQLGVGVANRGSDTDCLFNPPACFQAGTNQAATQRIPNALGRMYHGLSRIPANCQETIVVCIGESHNAILRAFNPPYVMQDPLAEILFLIGPQRVSR
jgi:hypothetical protein